MSPQEAEEYLENWISGGQDVFAPDLFIAMREVSVSDPAFAKQIIQSLPTYINREERDWPVLVEPLVRAYVQHGENRSNPVMVMVLCRARTYMRRIPRGSLTVWHIENALRSILYTLSGDV